MTPIRSRVTRALRLADETGDPAWLRFAVVGGGPTGIELAAEIAELVGARRARISLLLADAPEPAQLRDLARRGVDVWLRTRVVAVDDEGLELDGALRMPARPVIWPLKDLSKTARTTRRVTI